MRIATTVPQDDLRKVKDAAKSVERDGYSVIATMENKHDPFLPLAVAAVETERVELATAIAISFSRSPMAVANASWDLNEASRGRFVLGLGTQVKAHNERRFSVPWTAPAPRMREYLLALKAIWRCWRHGEKLDFEGEHYRFTLMTPEFSPKKAGLPLPPISLAAVGPDMLRMSGRVADGVRLHGFCTRKYIENVCMPRIEEGMAKSGRRREALEISGGGFIATGHDEAAVKAKLDWVRYRVGFYGSTRTYLPVFEQHGLEDLGLKLHRLSVEGKWNELAGQVSDDVARLFAAVGDYEALPEAAAERYGGVVDTLRLDLPDDIDPDRHRELVAKLKAIPGRFEAFDTAAA